MKRIIPFLALLLMIFSCKKENKITDSELVCISKIDTLYQDSISIRALTIKDSEVWFAGSNGKYGAINFETHKVFRGRIQFDTIFPEFRSIASNKEEIFIMSVASPGLLYKISNDKKVTKLVYQENGEKVFYDSMQFLDNSSGFAMGDPIENCLNVIKTQDGGKNWSKINCDVLPKVEDGEAAFAASNTNLIIRNNTIFMVSGGKKSRCFVSEDLGKTWNVYDTPIIQGETMTGIFTADFYNDKIGIVAGGNYENQTDNSTNKAITTDGGKTWKLIAKNKGFGYASCIQFVPNTEGKEIMCAGGTGIYYSKNFGEDWKKIHEAKDIYTFRFLNDSIAFAAGRNNVLRINLKK